MTNKPTKKCWVVERRKKDKDGQDEPLFVCVSYNQLVLPPKFQPYVRVVQKKKGKPMSEPRTDYHSLPNGITTEIMSAMSALNMNPEPLPPDQIKHDTGYLADTDRWAAHAMDHLHAAYALVQKMSHTHYLLELLMLTKGIDPKPLKDEQGQLVPQTNFAHEDIIDLLNKRYLEARQQVANQQHAKRLIDLAHKNGDFVQDVDGFYYYHPSALPGSLAAHELQIIATELDRLNQTWTNEVKAMESGSSTPPPTPPPKSKLKLIGGYWPWDE